MCTNWLKGKDPSLFENETFRYDPTGNCLKTIDGEDVSDSFKNFINNQTSDKGTPDKWKIIA